MRQSQLGSWVLEGGRCSVTVMAHIAHMKALPLEGHHLPKASPRWVLRCFPQPL